LFHWRNSRTMKVML